MKILITGASGNLGGKLLPELYKTWNKFAVILRDSSVLPREINEYTNLAIFRYSSELEIQSCVENFNPDLIIHTACSYGANGESEAEVSRVNIDFGWSIIQALDLKNSLKTFVNINTALPREVSIYANSKHQFSDNCRDFSKKSFGKFKFIDVVTQTIYDTGAHRSGFISHVIEACLRGGESFQLTAGKQKRDFIHSDDVVEAIKTIVMNLESIPMYEQFELGSGTSSQISDVVWLIHRLSKSKTNLIFGALPYRNNEPMDLVADISKLAALGWAPSVKLENKLEEIISNINNAKRFD